MVVFILVINDEFCLILFIEIYISCMYVLGIIDIFLVNVEII